MRHRFIWSSSFCLETRGGWWLRDSVPRPCQVTSELRAEMTRQADAIEREKDSRRRLNDMLQGYKDEVSIDTLISPIASSHLSQ
jgi:hypothetical protein